MQELEEILEEIEEGTYTFELLGREVDFVAIDWVRDIIRKHMNDGWLPVEERLPEECQKAWESGYDVGYAKGYDDGYALGITQPI